VKILAVDDQKIVLDLIRSQVDCQVLGIDELDIVTSADAAREKYREYKYEIMLCDIEMPAEDGLSLAKWVNEFSSDTKIIFLTSHADFNYVKEAISIHGFEYLLQPVSKDDLERVLQNAIIEYHLQEKKRMLEKKGSFYQSREEEVLRRGVLSWLLSENEDEMFLKNLMDFCEIGSCDNLVMVPFTVLITKRMVSSKRMERALQRFILENIMNEQLYSIQGKCVLMIKNDEEYAGILFLTDYSHGLEKRKQLYDKISIIQKNCDMLLGIESLYCFGKEVVKREVKSAYQSLQKYISQYVPKGEKVIWETDEGSPMVKEYSFEDEAKLWHEMLTMHEYNQFCYSIWNMLDKNKEQINVYFMIPFHQAFSRTLLRYLIECNIPSQEIFKEPWDYSTYMNSYSNVEKFREMVHYIAGVLAQKSDECEDVIDIVVKYIKEHVDEPMSVSEIADYVCRTPESLTKLFRKRTGYSIKEAIVHEKMEMAKMLLTKTEMTVTLIADHVGYENYNTFIRTFKTVEKCTPLEYRNNS